MKCHKCANLIKDLKCGLGETKPYYCKGDYIWSDENGNITSKSRQEFEKSDGDAYHYDRWIKEIKENPTTKKYLDRMISDGIEEDTALNIMILAWQNRRQNDE